MNTDALLHSSSDAAKAVITFSSVPTICATTPRLATGSVSFSDYWFFKKIIYPNLIRKLFLLSCGSFKLIQPDIDIIGNYNRDIIDRTVLAVFGHFEKIYRAIQRVCNFIVRVLL